MSNRPHDREFRFRHEDSEAYAAALDLHALVMELIPDSQGWRGLRSQLGRATMRIVMWIAEAEHLSDGRSLRLLDKAGVGCVNVCAAWDALRAGQRLTDEQHSRAKAAARRLAELIAGSRGKGVPSSPPAQPAQPTARLQDSTFAAPGRVFGPDELHAISRRPARPPDPH